MKPFRVTLHRLLIMIIFARKQEKDEIPYPYFLKGFKGLKSSMEC